MKYRCDPLAWLPPLDGGLLWVQLPPLILNKKTKNNIRGMKTMLKEDLNWNEIYVAPRYAGGHEEVMNVLFKDAEVVASYIQSGYQGDEAFLYHLNNEYILVTDYFGSCSGCDAWEEATDEEVKGLCTQLANNAQRFDTITEVINFLSKDVKQNQGAYYAESGIADGLLENLKENIVHMRDVIIDDILGS